MTTINVMSLDYLFADGFRGLPFTPSITLLSVYFNVKTTYSSCFNVSFQHQMCLIQIRSMHDSLYTLYFALMWQTSLQLRPFPLLFSIKYEVPFYLRQITCLIHRDVHNNLS